MKETDSKSNMANHLSNDTVNKMYRITIPVELRFSDIDSNNHLFFGNYFTLFDTAFLKYLQIIGYSFSRFLTNNLNLYYVEAKSQFKSPVKFDDKLCIEVHVSSVGKSSFTTSFKAINKTSNSSAALGHIVVVVVDLKTETPSSVPKEFIQASGCAGPR